MKRTMKRRTAKRNHKGLTKVELFTFLHGKTIFVTLETFKITRGLIEFNSFGVLPYLQKYINTEEVE